MIPTRERVGASTPLTGAALAAFRQRVLEVERIVKRNAAFLNGIRPIRVRTTIDYSAAAPRTAILNTVAYNREAWIAARCDVIPQADRGGGVSDGAIHIVINDPRTFFGGGSNDGVLETFEEPVRTGTFGGHPEYNGMYVLLSRGDRVPWVPVTAAEALDREERRIRTEQAQWIKDKARPWMSESAIQKSYEALKAVNAEAAEQNRRILLKALDDEKVRRPKLEAETDAVFARRLSDLAAYRASLTPEELQAQASTGAGAAGALVVNAPKGRRLVKVDPALARLEPDRLHFMRVFVGGVPADPVPGRWPWQQRTKQQIDFDALSALLEGSAER